VRYIISGKHFTFVLYMGSHNISQSSYLFILNYLSTLIYFYSIVYLNSFVLVLNIFSVISRLYLSVTSITMIINELRK